jgi:hypothetical protein
MKNPRPLFLAEFTFNQAARHLNTHAEHRLGDFNVLALQLDAAIRKFDDF